MSTTDTVPVIPMWTLGDRLRKARHHAELDTRAMAEVCGVTQASISQWETGASKPRDLLAVTAAYSEATGVDQAWLLGVSSGPRDFQMEPSPDDFGLAA